jgi:hypothetical protein
MLSEVYIYTFRKLTENLVDQVEKPFRSLYQGCLNRVNLGWDEE